MHAYLKITKKASTCCLQLRGGYPGRVIFICGSLTALKKCVGAVLPIDRLPGLGFLLRPSKDLLLVGLGGISWVGCKCAGPA